MVRDKSLRGRQYARLGRLGGKFAWLFEPKDVVSDESRGFLLAQLFNSPIAAVMGALTAMMVLLVALLRSGSPLFLVLLALEILLVGLRVLEWRSRVKRVQADSDHVPAVDATAILSIAWCALQGFAAFVIMADGGPVMRVLSATLIMALIGPLCARNYAAPRFAFLLVLLCDIPFVAGALVSGDPWFWVLAAMTPPFLLGAMQIINSFHGAMLTALCAEEESRHLASHDSLTGILNRQGLDQQLARLSPQSGQTMALLCIDLDGFKPVNDRHGHGAGDLVLIEVARRITAAVSEEDLVARMGGDEFMVVKRRVRPHETRQLAETLIDAISNRPIQIAGNAQASVGVSIGFACLPEDATTTVELRLRADEALYAAKGAGKGVAYRYGRNDAGDIDDIGARLKTAYSA